METIKEDGSLSRDGLVYRLPMRDGNTTTYISRFWNHTVYRLPMRDGNKDLFSATWDDVFVYRLPMRDGNFRWWHT